MKRQSPSIFNDIVGPIMVGPSSSHTCGPARIGYLSSQLLKSNLKAADVEFARKGAYTNMYQGQHSDMGFISGLLGYMPEDIRLRLAFHECKKRNIDINFIISDFEPIVPNIAKLTLYGENNEKVEVYSDSTGGGTVKLLKIDGYDVSIVGDCYETLIYLDTDNEEIINKSINSIKEITPQNEGLSHSTKDNSTLINLKTSKELSNTQINIINSLENKIDIKTIKPVLKVLSNRNANLPFKTAKDLLDICNNENKELWEVAIDYECSRSNWSREEVIEFMKNIIEIMESGVKEALKGDIDMNGVIKPTAGKIDNHRKAGNSWLNMGVLNSAVTWAMATMEYSSAMGVVLCAPTGGSAGVFPGAILGVANEMDLDKDTKAKMMLTTTVIGIAMSAEHNYSAELYGCQVEPGAASAMAAGGLVYLLEGTPKQSLDAASCAIQNILGTVCDPVAGLVQVPCISRNAMSVSNSVVCANMVIGGYDPCIPLDESAETMFRVGKQLPRELRCTCEGGLCTTPTGQRLAKEQIIRDNKFQERMLCKA